MSRSGTSTPRDFASQAASAEDLLKSQTVGLVQLDDYRKRRRDVDTVSAESSGVVMSHEDSVKADNVPTFTKKKKTKTKHKLLSFDEEGEDAEKAPVLRPKDRKAAGEKVAAPADEDDRSNVNRKLKPNPNASVIAPKARTKANLAAEAAERERLQVEFVRVQEVVRNAEIAIPFVFYDGSDMPGGTVKIKKGEQVWLFLERCRKLGAEMGVSSEGSVEGGGTKQKVEGKKSWARIGVDDLMLVRGGVVIPHHYEFYYFIANKVPDPGQPERLLFDYKGTASVGDEGSEQKLLRVPKNEKVEGQDDEAAHTKVVDRRWYERNKHIYPASLWREYKTGKEFEQLLQTRRDTQGNSFFF